MNHTILCKLLIPSTGSMVTTITSTLNVIRSLLVSTRTPTSITDLIESSDLECTLLMIQDACDSTPAHRSRTLVQECIADIREVLQTIKHKQAMHYASFRSWLYSLDLSKEQQQLVRYVPILLHRYQLLCSAHSLLK